MLKFMRRKSKSIFVYMVFGAIVIVFVFWGMGSFRVDRSDIVATINDKEVITLTDFFRAYQNQMDFYRNLYQDNFSEDLIERLNLKEKTLEDMIRMILLLKEAERLNIKVSQEELLDRIKSMPAFQRDGIFNKGLYLRVLSRNRISPNRFENDVRNDLITKKVERIITLPVGVSDIETKEFFNYNERNINLQYTTLNASSFKDSFVIDEKEAIEFFNKNIETFKVPTKVKVGFLRLRPVDFASKVRASEEELEDYYNKNIETFKEEKRDIKEPRTQPLEEVKLKIGVIITSEKAKRMALKKAQEIADKTLTNETSLKEMVLKEGFEIKETGPFSKEERDNEIAVNPDLSETAFFMKVGEISNAIETPEGIFVLELLKRREEHLPTFDEVSTSVKSFLAKMKSTEKAEEVSQELLKRLRKGEDIFSLAKDKELKVAETGLFSMRKGFIPGMGLTLNEGGPVFSLNPRSPYITLNKGDRYYVIKLKETQPPAEEEFEKKKETIRRYLLELKRRETFSKWVESLIDKAEIEINTGVI